MPLTDWDERKDVAKTLQDGMWVTAVSAKGDSVRLKVRSRDSVVYLEALARALKPIRAKYRDTTKAPPGVMTDMLRRLTAEVVLIDWERSDFGRPYSVDAGLDLLERYPEILDQVTGMSGDYGTFLVDVDEEQQKNSSSGSGGS